MESGTRKMENGTQKTENGMKTFHEQFLFGGQFKKLNVNKIKTWLKRLKEVDLVGDNC